MRGSPTVLWTCDKCGTTTSVLADATPPAWRKVRSFYLGSTSGDYGADWCGDCVKTYLRRNKEGDR